MKLTVLSGGVGGAKLVHGAALHLGQDALTVIPNTGDDTVQHGLLVQPDPDIVTYTLAGQIDREKGWGMRDESFVALAELDHLGQETWFGLGDRDLATHILRNKWLGEGVDLCEVARRLARARGVTAAIELPTSDPVRTRFRRDDGWVDFQEHFIRDRTEPRVHEIRYEGADRARANPAALAAIRDADAVIVAPSNPLASIGPILAVDELREALAATPARRIAVCPLVGGRSLKGPTDRMMAAQGFAVDATGVAAFYRGMLDAMLIDPADEALASVLRATGLDVAVAPTVMSDDATRRSVAASALELA